jgi:transposase
MRTDRDDHSDVHNDVSKPVRLRRVEVLNGVERRRKWPDETKFAIVAEALEPGVVISDVARRHDINPSQLFGWVRQFRGEVLAASRQPHAPRPPLFVPTVLDPAPAPVTKPARAPCEAAAIEISIGPATVRVRGPVDGKALAIVLKALRVLA